ncbi:MAG: phage tail sheath family protein [Saprospiraceae bacterium]|nr:phage tail sheath family protein [Saprospiraceae bacterium]
MAQPIQTPGVYIAEQNAFPNSVVPVATAVPAFIGYTEKAARNQQSLTNVPTRISSLGEYHTLFGAGPDTRYELSMSTNNAKPFALNTQIETRFLLYHSMKLFFANGGSDCFIVSIGDYHQKPGLADFDGASEENGKRHVKGIAALEAAPEPSLLVIPDAVLLGAEDCATVQRLMLAHCAKMASRFAILDVYMDENDQKQPDTQQIVQDFRNRIGTDHLAWGAAYYPWLHTSVTVGEDVLFRHVARGSWENLIQLLLAETDEAVLNVLDKKRADTIRTEIHKIRDAGTEDATGKHDKVLHQTLMAVSPLYQAIMTAIREKLSFLPPSAAIAGVYCMVDNQMGVFKAPANIGISSVSRPAVNLTNEAQEDLNAPLDGKAVNAIRTFPGKGVLAWGARTLDGNSQDWRYVSVRRTLIYIEQSVKFALEAYVFEPNDANTWTTVQALISNFLTNFWMQGGLAGTKPNDAFSVAIGLGTTMTAADVQNCIMRVTVMVAVIRPAEFIVITFQQKMHHPPN